MGLRADNVFRIAMPAGTNTPREQRRLPGWQFFATVLELFARAFRERAGLSFAILLADAGSASSRVLAVMCLSLIAVAIPNAGLIEVWGREVQLPPDITTIGIIAGAAVGLLYALSSVLQWIATWLARRLARWMSEATIADVLNGIQTDMRTAMAMPPVEDLNFLRLITQNSLHTGMMTETSFRLFNPFFLFVLAWLAVMFKSPLLGIGIVMFATLFVPIFLALFIGLKSNADSFYADTATEMGAGVSEVVSRVDMQHGVYARRVDTDGFAREKAMGKFLENLDTNILANEKIGLVVGTIGALFVGFVIGVNGWLADRGDIDLQGLMVIAGAFLYLVAAARTVMSMVTNLVRFYPQVLALLNFTRHTVVDAPDRPLQPLPHAISIEVEPLSPSDSLSSIRIAPGQRVVFRAPFGASKFVSLDCLRALVAASTVDGRAMTYDDLAPHLVYLSAFYRFQPGLSVMDNLSGGVTEREGNVHALLEIMGVREEFERLSEGYNTPVDERVYESLSGEGRTALRLVPVLADSSPRFLVIHVGAVRNLNPVLIDTLLARLTGSYLVFAASDDDIPVVMGDLFLFSHDGKAVEAIGGRALLGRIDVERVAGTAVGVPETTTLL